MHKLFDDFLLFVDYTILDQKNSIVDSGEKCISMEYYDFFDMHSVDANHRTDYEDIKILAGDTKIKRPANIQFMHHSGLINWMLYITKIQIMASADTQQATYNQYIGKSQYDITFSPESGTMEGLKAGKTAIYDSAVAGKKFDAIQIRPDMVSDINLQIDYVLKDLCDIANASTVESLLTSQS
jgi:hypothetical protein